MTDRLKAWCHWKRKEKHVREDTMLMVRDIEELLEANAKLREVAEAAKEVARFLEPEWRDDIERGDADTAMVEALKKLESVK